MNRNDIFVVQNDIKSVAILRAFVIIACCSTRNRFNNTVLKMNILQHTHMSMNAAFHEKKLITTTTNTTTKPAASARFLARLFTLILPDYK